MATRELLEAGVLVETGVEPSGGGRPGTLLGLSGGRRAALGVKVTPNHLTMARVDLDGTPEPSVSLDLDMRAPDAPEQISRAVAQQVESTGQLLGVGLAIPGFVESQDSGEVTSPILGWHRLPLGALVHERVGLPVLIDNDVNALAIAARLYEPGDVPDDALVVTIGYGIGCALVTDGEIYRGGRGGAGELGHVPVVPDGEVCECGLRGCLETLIGDNALARQAVAAGVLPAGGTKDELNAAAIAGDPGARDLFADAGVTLARALLTLVHVFDPDAVLISGEGVDVWRFWEPGFDAAWRANLPRHRLGLPVRTRPWGEDTWARGAAALVFASPFDRRTPGRQSRRVSAMLQAQPAG